MLAGRYKPLAKASKSISWPRGHDAGLAKYKPPSVGGLLPECSAICLKATEFGREVVLFSSGRRLGILIWPHILYASVARAAHLTTESERGWYAGLLYCTMLMCSRGTCTYWNRTAGRRLGVALAIADGGPYMCYEQYWVGNSGCSVFPRARI